MRLPRKGMVRGVALVSVAGALGMLLLGRQAMAELGERSLAIAPGLVQWAELVGQATELEVNGQHLGLSTTTTDAAPSEVLARFEALCKQASPELTDDLREVQGSGANPPADEPFSGVWKQEYADAGGVGACLAQSGGLKALTSSVAEFLAQRDLAVFGQFRYLIARKTEDGGTHALFIYNRGALRLDEMLPARGDAAGGDLQGVPRPAEGTRVLSAQATGRPYGLVAYATKGPPREALSRYVEQLGQAGIHALRVVPDAAGEIELRGAVQNGEPLVVQAFEVGGETVISVVKLGGRLTRQFAATR